MRQFEAPGCRSSAAERVLGAAPHVAPLTPLLLLTWAVLGRFRPSARGGDHDPRTRENLPADVQGQANRRAAGVRHMVDRGVAGGPAPSTQLTLDQAGRRGWAAQPAARGGGP